VIVRTLEEVVGTDRDVRAPTFHSRRLLLAGDGTEFSLHDTTLHAGTSTAIWYRNHVEAVYCLEGRGRLVDAETGRSWTIEPGLVYALDGHERHEVHAETDLRVLCVFTPALVGAEVHDEDGSYPLLAPPPAAAALGPASPEDRYPSRRAPTPSVTARLDPVVYGRPGDGPLDTAHLGDFDRDGFLQLPPAFDEAEVAAFRAEMAELGHRPDLRRSGRTVFEPRSEEVRSVFEVHKVSDLFAELAADERLVAVARQILGSEVYIHQSRVNYKPGFGGRGFDWHTDFETWHTEDGLAAMRTVSFSVALTPNRAENGPLMIIPGSHRWFVSCVGATPAEHYRRSLRHQEIGVPDEDSLRRLVEQAGGIRHFEGEPGSVTVFDCNAMHGSPENMSPHPRSNVFLVYNSVENPPREPFSAPGRRPTFVAAREVEPVRPLAPSPGARRAGPAPAGR